LKKIPPTTPFKTLSRIAQALLDQFGKQSSRVIQKVAASVKSFCSIKLSLILRIKVFGRVWETFFQKGFPVPKVDLIG
jgi:hypothetical protein